ncbi:hypothetical protein LI328DRAFT_124114 [Trichoderma asperelloides]|nr:hypothetical protein LI328DRAFT_124114 [Trichoderma asperelloides]
MHYFRPPEKAVLFRYMSKRKQPSILFAFRVLRDSCSEVRQKKKRSISWPKIY